MDLSEAENTDIIESVENYYLSYVQNVYGTHFIEKTNICDLDSNSLSDKEKSTIESTIDKQSKQIISDTFPQFFENLVSIIEERKARDLIKEIQQLRKVGNSLFECNSIDDIFEKVAPLVKEKIKAQTLSLFLLSKDNILERRKLAIFNLDEKEDLDSWLSEEHYDPKEEVKGFSGKAITDCSHNVYGQVYFSDDLKEEELRYRKAYESKLGVLKCGISVPLNGTHRTFGTVEVLNKIDPKSGKASKIFTFSKSDIYWFTILGAHIANAISRIQRKIKDDIISKINFELASFSNRYYAIDNSYEKISQKLIEKYLPYKVCIIRLMVNNDSFFEVVGKAKTDDIDWDGRVDNHRKKGEGIVGSVFQTGKEERVHINENNNIDRFLNKDWVLNQRFETYICYPIKMGDNVLGAISLFTGCKYEPVDTDWSFLKNISFQIAAFYAVDRLIPSADDISHFQKTQYFENGLSKTMKENEGYDDSLKSKRMNKLDHGKKVSPKFSLERLIREPDLFRENAMSEEEFIERALDMDRELQKDRKKRLVHEDKMS